MRPSLEPGRRTLALKQWGSGAIDYKWQLSALKFLLKKHGVFGGSGPEPNAQPQKAPKSDRR